MRRRERYRWPAPVLMLVIVLPLLSVAASISLIVLASQHGFHPDASMPLDRFAQINREVGQ